MDLIHGSSIEPGGMQWRQQNFASPFMVIIICTAFLGQKVQKIIFLSSGSGFSSSITDLGLILVMAPILTPPQKELCDFNELKALKRIL
jgi:hypothetical protein